jgi:hypothetical protein
MEDMSARVEDAANEESITDLGINVSFGIILCVLRSDKTITINIPSCYESLRFISMPVMQGLCDHVWEALWWSAYPVLSAQNMAHNLPKTRGHQPEGEV